MNDDSKAVIRFLEALQGYRAELGELRNSLIQRGAKNAVVVFHFGIPFRVHKANNPSSTLSGTVSLGFHVAPRAGEEKDFTIDIYWDANTWYIDTEIWVDDPDVNQRLVREFPQRRTPSLDECFSFISAAIDDLRQSDELWAGLR